MSRDPATMNEDECRTFMYLIMAVFIYRGGQRPEWIRNYTLKDYEDSVETANGDLQLFLHTHKTSRTSKDGAINVRIYACRILGTATNTRRNRAIESTITYEK